MQGESIMDALYHSVTNYNVSFDPGAWQVQSKYGL